MKILSLDPSVNSVGWATFEIVKGRKHEKKKAWKWGTWYLEGSSLEMRMLDLCQTISQDIGNFDILVTEKPAFYSSEVGQIAAHRNYTIDLSAVNNFVAGWFHRDHRTYFPITAIAWKGTVPKWITANRFYKAFKLSPRKQVEGLTEHSIDATMLLHFWLKTYAVRGNLLAQHISAESLQSLL